MKELNPNSIELNTYEYDVTIFTPTYNRAYILPQLYKSLAEQTVQSFEWLIVDDGSIDNTEIIVNNFLTENKINIQYVKKENEGKHIAINDGVKIAKGKLFFIVDSDDYLTPDAVEKILFYAKQIEGTPNYAGIVGLKGDNQKNVIFSGNKNYGEKIPSQLKREYIDATSVEYRYKHKIKGDRAEVILTDLLLEIPFPKFEDERFMEESYLWFTLSNSGYKFRWFNQVIYIAEYLDDGLTKNMRELVKKNWKSHCFCANYALKTKGIPLKVKIREGVRYFRYGKYGGESYYRLFKEVNNKVLGFITLPVSIIFKIKSDR